MPYPSQSPVLYDECLRLNISDVKRLGYIQPQYNAIGVLTWKKRENVIASVQISAEVAKCKRITLAYTYQANPVIQQIYLTAITSNLGNGDIYFFICPITGKRCRALLLHNGLFCHRTAIGGLYDSQTYSRKSRALLEHYKRLKRKEAAIERIQSKHFTRTYRGKPSKRFERLSKDINDAKGIKEEQLLIA